MSARKLPDPAVEDLTEAYSSLILACRHFGAGEEERAIHARALGRCQARLEIFASQFGIRLEDTSES